MFDEFLPSASPGAKLKAKKPFFGQTNENFASVNAKLNKEAEMLKSQGLLQEPQSKKPKKPLSEVVLAERKVEVSKKLKEIEDGLCKAQEACYK